jgi:hypothetical protein
MQHQAALPLSPPLPAAQYKNSLTQSFLVKINKQTKFLKIKTGLE